VEERPGAWFCLSDAPYLLLHLLASFAPANSTQKGEVQLTDMELTKYDGSDPTKPIYLALNGTIYDVSASPQTYGPGGSYHFFAGRDAARAFLTGCFAEDAVPDLRGVERMFMPVDPEDKADATSEVIEAAKSRKKLSKAEEKNRRAQELRSRWCRGWRAGMRCLGAIRGSRISGQGRSRGRVAGRSTSLRSRCVRRRRRVGR
jgi:predicted heme/steroid binding protein